MSRKTRRKKFIRKPKETEAQKKARAKRSLITLCSIVVVIVATVVIGYIISQDKKLSNTELFESKAELLMQQVLSGDRDNELSGEIEDGLPKSAVFISISNGDERARVFTGTGADKQAAWDDAYNEAHAFVEENSYDCLWVKADLMGEAKTLSSLEFPTELHHYREGFFRKGIAFDRNFDTALLEAELNGAKILDYDTECINTTYLRNYLNKAGRTPIVSLPDEYIVFNCVGWICDENSKVYELRSDDANYGRRKIDLVDKDYAAMVVNNASSFLIDQVNDDGSFVYGMYPRFDREIDSYNIVRHASTLWSLVCQYRMTGNDELVSVIDKAIDYMIDTSIITPDDDIAYLVETKSDEIKLGGCGVAVVALTEYMDAFGSDKYKDVAVKLGNGILTMLNEETGEYYHVLNGDCSRKEQFRVIYYDGEATFALCRLYSLTGDEKWLNAAKAAVEHFIDADYVQFKDHWVAYSLNELTKYVNDERYYTFALRNAQENLDTIYNRDTTYHTYFELLTSTFELYDRMIERGIHVDYLDNGFDLEYFLKTIYKRADHMLNGYFYPEYAMYMANPNRVLDTFMVRHDGYRIRIDDVQHSVGGFYLYYKNYDKLVEYGMLECRDKT